jgi:hypothetical protein
MGSLQAVPERSRFVFPFQPQRFTVMGILGDLLGCCLERGGGHPFWHWGS